ncbi:MAG TPA: hypothetical protein VKT72_09025 [Candidatus Baltobacteraceae bacterium]|nr:hypothetical protein [Candidatus Baltobacteraceae bacterium]
MRRATLQPSGFRKTSGGTVTLGSDDAAGLYNTANARLRAA